jgi:hypothetical protein
MRQFDDEIEQRLAFRQLGLESLALRTQELGMLQAAQQMQEAAQSAAAQRAQRAMELGVRALSEAAASERQAAQISAARQLQMGAGEAAPFLPKGVTMQPGAGTPPEDVRKRAFAVAEGYQRLNSALTNLVQLRQNLGVAEQAAARLSEKLDTPDVKRLRAAHAAVLDELRKWQEAGANLTGTEIKIMQDEIGADPVAIEFAVARLNETKRRMEARFDATLDTWHMQRAGAIGAAEGGEFDFQEGR